MRHEYRAYPSRQPLKQEAAAEAFCGLYNATFFQRMVKINQPEAMLAFLLNSDLISVSLFRPKLLGQKFKVEQTVTLTHSHRAIQALLRLLHAKTTTMTDDGPGASVLGRIGFSGQIRTHGRRLPRKPRSVVLVYYRKAWFLCFVEGFQACAYRLKYLLMTYRATAAR